MEANFYFNDFMLCKWPFIIPEKQNLRVTSQKTIEREVVWFSIKFATWQKIDKKQNI